MRWILKKLFRERRRLAVIAALTFLGGYLSFAGRGVEFYGIPMSIVAGLAFMLGLTTFLMGLAVFFPKIRHTLEAVALSIPALALMGTFDGTGSMATSTRVYTIMLCYLVATVYGGAWMDRYLPTRPRRFRSKATSRLSPEQLWPYLTVTPDSFADYAEDDILSMKWIEPGISFLQVGRMGDLGKIEEIHRIEVDEPFERYLFSFEVPDAPPTAPVSRGSREIRLTRTADGTLVETTRVFDRVSIRALLFIFIDDGMGRLDDDAIRKAETRNGNSAGGAGRSRRPGNVQADAPRDGELPFATADQPPPA